MFSKTYLWQSFETKIARKPHTGLQSVDAEQVLSSILTSVASKNVVFLFVCVFFFFFFFFTGICVTSVTYVNDVVRGSSDFWLLQDLRLAEENPNY